MARVRKLVRTFAPGLVAILGAGACGDDEPSGPPRVPTSITAQTSTTLAATVASILTPGPTVIVRDQDGKPLRRVEVRFAVTGGGTIENTTARTNSSGAASAGKWTLGTGSGVQNVTATAATLTPVEFRVTANPGVPATLTVHAGGTQSATVGTIVGTVPAAILRDQFANPVPGIPVSFAVRTGSGTATGTAVTTDANGIAAVGSWTLGTRAGSQTLGADVAGLPTVLFTVNATAASAHLMRLVSGAEQITEVSGLPAAPIVVQAWDRFDNPLVDRVLALGVTEGGGWLEAGSVTTDAQGRATIPWWHMGPAEGLNAMTVSVDALPALTVFGKAVPVSSYDIVLRYLSTVTPGQQQAFENAAARWRKVIIGDLQGGLVTLPQGACGLGEPALNEVIDDLLIYAMVVPIDGAGSVIASAGPCVIRSANGLALIGIMRFDEADLAEMDASGRLEDVILHEMGHVIGIGGGWNRKQLVVGRGTTDPYYIGVSGLAAFASVGGTAYTGNPVPVEAIGGAGTRDVHWRESELDSELMTGFIEAPGPRLPLSLVTIGSLEDLGYQITIWGDDRYRYGQSLRSLGRGSAPPRELIEAPLPITPRAMDAQGRFVPLDATMMSFGLRSSSVTRVAPRPAQQLEVRRPD